MCLFMKNLNKETYKANDNLLFLYSAKKNLPFSTYYELQNVNEESGSTTQQLCM